jgi:hypothetical protein
VFGALLLWGHRGIHPASLELRIRSYNDEARPHEGEKGVGSAAAGHNSTTSGTLGVVAPNDYGAPVSGGTNTTRAHTTHHPHGTTRNYP